MRNSAHSTFDLEKDWEFLKSTRFEVGNGKRINYGMIRCDDIPLKNSFPSLFTIVYFKESWAEDIQGIEGEMVT